MKTYLVDLMSSSVDKRTVAVQATSVLDVHRFCAKQYPRLSAGNVREADELPSWVPIARRTIGKEEFVTGYQPCGYPVTASGSGRKTTE